MIKREELAKPASCLNKASDDEMLFILLARDPAAPATIRFWIKERIRLNKNHHDDAKIIEAEQCAQAMEKENHP